MCDLETSRMRRPWPALGRSTTGGGSALLWSGYLATLQIIMIVFFYQLDAQIRYFNTFIIILYMFRALLCLSSGGQLY